MNTSVSSPQVFRVTNCISEYVEEATTQRLLSPAAKEEVLYAEVDGSMILTKEEQWHKVKLGWMFKSSDCLNPNMDNCLISQSHYVCHLGSSSEFVDKMTDS